MEKRLLYMYIDDFCEFHKQEFNFSTNEEFCVYGTEALILQKRNCEKPLLKGFWGESILDINMLIGDNGSGKTTLMKVMIGWICRLSQGNLPQEKGILVFKEDEKIGYIAFKKGDKLELSVNISGAEEYTISHVKEFVKGLQLLYFSNTMTDLNLSNDILRDCSLYRRMIKANEGEELLGKNIIENYNQQEFRDQVDMALNKGIEDFPVSYLQMEVRPLDFADIMQGVQKKDITDRLTRLWEEYFESRKDRKVSEKEQLVIELLKRLLIGVIKRVLHDNKKREKKINKLGELIKYYDSIYEVDNIEKGMEELKNLFKDLILDNVPGIEREKRIADINRFVSLLQSSVRKVDGQLAEGEKIRPDREGIISVQINIGPKNREKFKIFWEAYKEIMIYMEKVSFSWSASSGERNWVSLFSILTSVSGENIWLFLDEPDNTLHPDWQRKLLDKIVEVCNGKNYEEKRAQIWISTHSPIMLSDMPGNSVIYLDDKKNMDRQFEETFGQNIYALFNHAFVLHDGVIGTFAGKKIKEVLEKLQKIEENLLIGEHDSTELDGVDSDLNYCEAITDLLAEPLFKRYFMDSIGKINEILNGEKVQQE